MSEGWKWTERGLSLGLEEWKGLHTNEEKCQFLAASAGKAGN